FRAAVERVWLDPFVAVSATIGAEDADGRLGPVDGGGVKTRAAGAGLCDRVLFEPTTGKSGKEGGAAPERPPGLGVAAGAEAWDEVTGGMQALAAFIAAEERAILSRLRFRPPRLRAAENGGSSDVTEVLESLHVPLQVLTRFEIPLTQKAAWLEEQARSRGF